VKTIRWLPFALFVAAAHAQPAPPADAAFEGTWVGRVTAPNASTEIGFAFIRGPKGLNARFAMPAMFVSGMNLGPAAVAGEVYTMPDLGIKLVRTGDALTGSFANPILRVELHRGRELPPALTMPAAPPAPAPAWSRPLGAKVWASPAVRDGVVYVGTVDGKMHAVRAADGGEVWTWSGPHALFGEALVTTDRVIFVDDACDCVCLARADGSPRWRTALRSGPPAAANPTFNHRTAVPVPDGDTIYVGSTDGGLCALDAANGAIRWRHELGAPIHAAVALDGDRLLVAAFDGTVVALDRRTQAELARVKLGGPIASAPVVAGDTVLVGCRDYLLYGLRRGDLTIAWRNSFWFSWVESVPRVVDGIAYIGGSDYRRISALEPATGAARWVTDVGGLTWGTPVVTANSVYAGTSAQNPAAIRHEGGITALDRRTGAVKWRHVVPLPPDADRAGYLGSLVVADGRLIGAGYDGTLVAFPVD